MPSVGTVLAPAVHHSRLYHWFCDLAVQFLCGSNIFDPLLQNCQRQHLSFKVFNKKLMVIEYR